MKSLAHQSSLDRRDLLRTAAGLGLAAAAGAASIERSARAADTNRTKRPGDYDDGPKISTFTESFQSRPVSQVCKLFAELGLDGLDLTVRGGGHIQPNEAPEKLPAAAKAAREHGIAVLMATTGVLNDNPTNEALVAAAGEAGIDRIKLGYFPYTKFGTFRERLDATKRQLEKIATMSAKHGVLPCLHTHMGSIIPSNAFVLYELVRDFPPDRVGAYVDTTHICAEGGVDSWRQGLDLVAPWIAIVGLKNHAWNESGEDKFGQTKWGVRTVPLAEGAAPLPEVFGVMKSIGYRGLYNLKSEYPGYDLERTTEQTKVDLAHVKKLHAEV